MILYNDNDPKCCAWITELINAGCIPKGDVLCKSITEISPNELTKYHQFHTFCGIGGWPLALKLAGWPEDRPIWSLSCPCQPFSTAGQGMGADDERHLWPYARNLIAKRRPSEIIGEQVASKAGREWLAGVFANLERMAYNRAAADLCAPGVRSPHIRQRLYWVADAAGIRCDERRSASGFALQGQCAERGGEQARPEQTGELPGRLEGLRGDGGLADAESERLNGQQGSTKPTGRRGVEDDSAISGLVQPNGAGRESRQSSSAPAGHRSPIESAGSTIGMGDALIQSRERTAGSILGAEKKISGERSQHGDFTNGLEHAGETIGGYWDEFRIIHMLDGKSRRIKSGSQLLVDGFPDGVDAGWLQGDGSIWPLAEKVEGRVGLLRGFGNAIVPELAAQFIRAYMDVRA